MRLRYSLPSSAAFATLGLLVSQAFAQYPEMIHGTYTDSETGIDFVTWSARPYDDGSGAFTFGIALPEDALTKDATEYIGILKCQIPDPERTGWCGFAHAGHMVDDLLLMAWPHNGKVLTSFRYTAGYYMPAPYYDGNSTVTQIRSYVNETNFELVFRCQDCFTWNNGADYFESVHTGNGDGYAIFGYAQSDGAIYSPECPEYLAFGFHEKGFAQWFAELEGAPSPNYAKWAALPAKTVTGSCDY